MSWSGVTDNAVGTIIAATVIGLVRVAYLYAWPAILASRPPRPAPKRGDYWAVMISNAVLLAFLGLCLIVGEPPKATPPAIYWPAVALFAVGGPIFASMIIADLKEITSPRERKVAVLMSVATSLLFIVMAIVLRPASP